LAAWTPNLIQQSPLPKFPPWLWVPQPGRNLSKQVKIASFLVLIAAPNVLRLNKRLIDFTGKKKTGLKLHYSGCSGRVV
jgi:hypothetical protein